MAQMQTKIYCATERDAFIFPLISSDIRSDLDNGGCASYPACDIPTV